MTPRPPIAIVIVSYNTRTLLLECLSSVFKSAQTAELEVVVVDNASTDGSFEAVRQAYPQVLALQNSRNVGFAAACNQGIRSTQFPFVLLFNSDAQLTPGSLQGLHTHLLEDPRCGAVGCRVVDADGTERVNTRNFLTAVNHASELTGIRYERVPRRLRRTQRPKLQSNRVDCSIEWIDGACLMLRRAALAEVGLLDERFFMYSEDEDLCYRLRERGWSVCFTAKGTVIHQGGASSEQDRFKMLCYFYSSQILFLSKHRGTASVFLYGIIMRTVLFLKHVLLGWGPGKKRREEYAQRISAFRKARSSTPGQLE